MYRVLLLLFFMIFSHTSMSGSAEDQIELADGTVINGDVEAVSNGNYIIRSTILGRIEVPKSSIRTIRSGGAITDSGSAYSTELQSIQRQIASSPELMQMVMALQSDQALHAAMNDPELIKLVMSGNYQAMQTDPRIIQLLSNPSIQAIVNKISEK